MWELKAASEELKGGKGCFQLGGITKDLKKKMAFELTLKGSNNKIYYFLIIYYVPGLLYMLFSNPHNNSKVSLPLF